MNKVIYIITIFILSALFACSNMVKEYQGDLSGINSEINTLYINSNAEYIYTPLSSLNLNATSAILMRFKNGNALWSSWFSYVATYPWNLGDALTGEKTVQAEIIDSAGTTHLLSDTIIFIDKIKSPAGLDNTGFGVSVAASSDAQTVVSGVKEGYGYAGACSWNAISNEWECSSLVRGDGLSNDRYGFSVSVSSDGNTAAVGAHGNNNVYVFTREIGIWVLKKIIALPDPDPSGAFGYSLSISSGGTVLIVGSPGVSGSIGASYVFEKDRGGINSWGLRRKITPIDGALYDKFGYSVAISNDGSKIAAGSFWHNGRSGAVYVYSWDGANYNQVVKLIDDAGNFNDNFGLSLAMSSDGNYIAAGSPYDDVNPGDKQGTLFVFKWNGVSYLKFQKIISPDGNINDSFGYSVSLSSNGNLLLIGSPSANIPGKDGIGSAYIMELSGGSYVFKKKPQPFDGQAEDQLGYGVSLSGNGTKAFCGSVFNDINSAVDNKGSIYIFPVN